MPSHKELDSKDLKEKGLIIVDINVANLQIRALKPDMQDLRMPNQDPFKLIFWNSVHSDRLNKRKTGTLKGLALRNALKLVERYGSISTSGEYGSMIVKETDFIEDD